MSLEEEFSVHFINNIKSHTHSILIQSPGIFTRILLTRVGVHTHVLLDVKCSFCVDVSVR